MLWGGSTPQELTDRRTNELRKQALPTLKRIATEHHISVDAMMSRSRQPDLVRARVRAMAVLRWSTGWSLPDLGRLFGRDHTTILAAVRSYEAELNP